VDSIGDTCAEPSGRRARTGGLSVLLPLVIAAAAAIAHAQGLRGEFLNWDDDRNFLQNPDYRGIGPAQWRWAWSTYHLGVWQPLAWLLLGAQHVAFGMNPLGYHATSLAIHALNAVLVYFLCRQVLRLHGGMGSTTTDHRCAWASASAAILFAVHPLRVEAVTWVSCQPYLPAVAVYLVAVMVHLRAVERRVDGSISRPAWLATFLLYVVALCFKAVAISLPAVLLVLDIWLLGRWKRGRRGRVLAEKIPFVVVAAVTSLWAIAAKDYNESRVPWREFDSVVRLAQSAWGVCFYLWKSAWPSGLLPYYRLPDDLRLTTPAYLLSAGMVLATTVTLLLIRRRTPRLLATWLCYLVILLPNLGVVQIGQQLAADRYSYLAIIAPMTTLAAGFRKVSHVGRQAGMSLVILSVLVPTTILTRLSWRQTAIWKTSESLWSTTIEADPACAVAHCNLGEALLRQDDLPAASKHLSTAIDLDPQFCFAYTNLGVLLCQARQFEEAAQCGEHVLSIRPSLKGLDLARAHAMLGQAYAGLRKDDLAWMHTRIAERLGLPEAAKMIEYLSSVSQEPSTKPAAR
jgi:protein O-mannosyl-transferase